MGKTCRFGLAVTSGCALLAVLALFCIDPAAGQIKRVQIKPPPPPPPQIIIGGPGGGPVFVGPGGLVAPGTSSGGSGSQFSAIKLAEKSEYRQFIEVARDCIKDKAWNDAATALQTILDNKEDFYVRVKERDPHTGRETERRTSVKYEANNLLGSMPEEGLARYELRFGGKARTLLDEARKKGDFEKIADVAQRYQQTQAGAEANDLLATYFLDRGQFFMAALRFERLLSLNPKRAKLSDLTLFKAAFAYRRAGDLKNAERTWQRLLPHLQDQGGLKIGDQLVSTDRLEQALDKLPRPEAVNPHDWPLIRGNLTNTAQANGSPPLLDEVLWRWPLAPDKNEISGEADDRAAPVNKWITHVQATRSQLPNNASVPVMPGFFPIAVGGKLVFRTYFGLSAYLLTDLKDADGKVVGKAGEFDWKSTDFEGSLGVLLGENKDQQVQGTINNWLTQYTNVAGSNVGELIYENSLIGTLSTDHHLVYAVDDLSVPAPPNLIPQLQWNPGLMPGGVKRLVFQNSLRAYDVQTGKEVWWLGNNPKNKDEFQDSLFLGPPLPVGGKLYVLNERTTNGELQLVCLNPADGGVIGTPQLLGTVEPHARVVQDLSRRIHAAHLGYGEGVLVCTTNAGELLGVDLLSRTLAWAYPYREKSPSQSPVNPGFPPGVIGRPWPGNFQLSPMSTGNWYSTPPVITEGKVVFTAPDASSVHCINLRDGVMVWKRPQAEGDLFLAGVFGGKVLIAGKNGVRFRRLSDGEQTAFLPTGDVPSGQGVASKNVYYLPLKKGEICAIDIARETIKAHNRAASANVKAPGNLVFYEGAVLSQTPTEVVAYPQLTVRLDLADRAVIDDPNNLNKLTTRGELRLADGQTQKAIDDLRTVLEKKPAADLLPRVRQKLYLAMTDLFQSDFNDASGKYLDEYRDLCKVPGNATEEQQRQARFLRLVGQGREAQGNLVEAFQAYKDFGALPIHKNGEISLPEDPAHKIPTSVWLRGRVSAMIARATPEQRKPLEVKIAAEWQAVRAKKDLDAIRSFVGMFDVPFTVGREARLQLADTIIQDRDAHAYLEAELNLEQLRVGALRDDPQVGGRALEALSRLEMRKGSGDAMRLAAAYLRELGHDFATARLRDGKTGADLLNELAADKRFLPHLQEDGPLWRKARIAAAEVGPGVVKGAVDGFIFQPEGDLSPMTRQQRLILDPANQGDPQLRLLDMNSNTVRWTKGLGAVSSNMQYFQFLYQQASNNTSFHPNAHFRFYQVKGHLAVLQVGTMAYGLDLEDPSGILWKQSLMEVDPTQNGMHPQQVLPDQDGNLQMLVWNQFINQQRRLRIGHIAAVQGSYVALVRQKSLVVLDPLRGTVLWTKADLPDETNVYGDDQYLYLVDQNGGSATAGRVLRASDGTPVEVPDFSAFYQGRIRLCGRRILASTPGKDGMVLRLYDVPAGKDVWTRTFDAKAVVLHTEDPGLTGVIEPAGKMTVLDARSGLVLATTNVVQGRITPAEVNSLREPLLLADQDRFYVALNRPIDPQQVMGGALGNNFKNGLRCAPVNGWVLAIQRHTTDRAKVGDFLWHSYTAIANQMVVLEQFDVLPILLFSSRFAEPIRGGFGGTRWVALTQSIDRQTGKMIYDPLNPRLGNGAPQFYAFTVDVKDGTINMVGYQGAVQHYVDDGRKRPEAQVGLGPASQGPVAHTGIGFPLQPPPGFGVRPIIRPRPVHIRPPVAVPPAVEKK
jgi:tetratricopeptide (TPR) repeat protein/outer membrane protein assembly factor BamB